MTEKIKFLLFYLVKDKIQSMKIQNNPYVYFPTPFLAGFLFSQVGI